MCCNRLVCEHEHALTMGKKNKKKKQTTEGKQEEQEEEDLDQMLKEFELDDENEGRNEAKPPPAPVFHTHTHARAHTHLTLAHTPASAPGEHVLFRCVFSLCGLPLLNPTFTFTSPLPTIRPPLMPMPPSGSSRAFVPPRPTPPPHPRDAGPARERHGEAQKASGAAVVV